MFRRPMFLLPAVLVAIAVPTAPALAGEGDGDADDGAASATLHAPSACPSGRHAKAVVTGEGIDSVAFHLDGRLVETAREPDADGRFSARWDCADLRRGAHRGKAVVTFEEGAASDQRILRFQLTRTRRAAPRFAG